MPGLGWLQVIGLVDDVEQDLEQRAGVHLWLHQTVDGSDSDENLAEQTVKAP